MKNPRNLKKEILCDGLKLCLYYQMIFNLITERKDQKKSDCIITENYHIRLGENVGKLLIEKINSNFNSKYNYKNNKQYSYQIILQDNLQQLSNFIVNKRKELDFVIPKMKLFFILFC